MESKDVLCYEASNFLTFNSPIFLNYANAFLILTEK